MHGATLSLANCYVRTISDGKIVLEKWAPGAALDLGLSVGVVVDGIDIIITSRRNQTFDTTIFSLHGIAVEKCSLVALKSSIHFRAGFRELTNGYKPLILTSDAPGLSSNSLKSFEHLRAAGPLWPLHPAVSYRAAVSNARL